jgi:uncharacterized membrane-anchored protein YhcB (DUF1043 family)
MSELIVLTFIVGIIVGFKLVINEMRKEKERRKTKEEEKKKLVEYEKEFQKELLLAQATDAERNDKTRLDYIKKRYQDFIKREKEIDKEIQINFSDAEKIAYFKKQGREGAKIIDMYLEPRRLVAMAKQYEGMGGEWITQMEIETGQKNILSHRERLLREFKDDKRDLELVEQHFAEQDKAFYVFSKNKDDYLNESKVAQYRTKIEQKYKNLIKQYSNDPDKLLEELIRDVVHDKEIPDIRHKSSFIDRFHFLIACIRVSQIARVREFFDHQVDINKAFQCFENIVTRIVKKAPGLDYLAWTTKDTSTNISTISNFLKEEGLIPDHEKDFDMWMHYSIAIDWLAESIEKNKISIPDDWIHKTDQLEEFKEKISDLNKRIAELISSTNNHKT